MFRPLVECKILEKDILGTAGKSEYGLDIRYYGIIAN